MNSRLEHLDRRLLFASLSGLWHGSRTEAGLRGTFATVTIDLNVKQSGSSITGTEKRTVATHAEYFADLTFKGALSGNSLALQDDSITAQAHPSNYKWLLYSATLQLSTDGQTLTGTWHGGSKHGSMTFSRVPLPTLTLENARTRDGKSITVDYSITTAAISQALTIEVFRSKKPELDSTARLIGTQTISAKSRGSLLSLGEHRAKLLSGTALTTDPTLPYVVVVANRNGAVVEADGSDNRTSFALR